MHKTMMQFYQQGSAAPVHATALGPSAGLVRGRQGGTVQSTGACHGLRGPAALTLEKISYISMYNIFPQAGNKKVDMHGMTHPSHDEELFFSEAHEKMGPRFDFSIGARLGSQRPCLSDLS